MQKEELWIRLSCLSDWTPEKYLKTINQIEKNLTNLNLANKESLFFYGFTAINIQQFWIKSQKEIEEDILWLNKENRYLLPLHHPCYPKTVFHSTRPPKLLWCEGNIDLLKQKTLSMIGSRTPSLYGKHFAKVFTKMITKEPLIITSGLAIGIDSVVHQALIEMDKPSIAILGSGLANIYPPCNQLMADNILKKNGLLLSEFSPKTQQTVGRFAAKNYLLSTLPKALFVLEATMQSGSLMTARFAIEEGRDVFCLAHPVGQSEGTHWLIKQGAHLISNRTDIQNHLNTELNWLRLNLTQP